jgi:pilus assembly protein CpaF
MTAVPNKAAQKVEIRQAANDSTVLTRAEKEWKHKIHQRLLQVMDLSLIGTVEEDHARTEIREIVQRLFAEDSAPLSLEQRRRIVQEIEDEVMGLGPLEPLLADPKVADILVNGPKQVFVERHGKLELTDVQFNDDDHLANIIDRIVSGVGRRIDESSPMVDARLKDGSRVNAVIPPLAIDGPMMSIRRFGVDLLQMEDLIEFGALTKEVAEVLRGIVKAELNILISGGTGAGKTTMLNVLSGFIPIDERIVTVEDSAELQLRQPHVVRLETRPPNIEGNGEVTQRDLVRNCLTTIHANTPRDSLTRVENMVSMTGINFPSKVLREQIASAIDVVIQLSRHEDGRRRLVSMAEINGMEGEVITMSELFRFERQGLDEDGMIIGGLKATGIVPGFHKTLSSRGIDLPIEVFHPEVTN